MLVKRELILNGLELEIGYDIITATGILLLEVLETILNPRRNEVFKRKSK
jgi:hypothetical protein